MRNYEIIEKLMEHPAGYHVEFGTTVYKEEISSTEKIWIGKEVDEIEIDDSSETITFC